MNDNTCRHCGMAGGAPNTAPMLRIVAARTDTRPAPAYLSTRPYPTVRLSAAAIAEPRPRHRRSQYPPPVPGRPDAVTVLMPAIRVDGAGRAV